jgi:hypothetical protein
MRENLIDFIDATCAPHAVRASDEPAQRPHGSSGPAGISFFFQDILSIHGTVTRPNRQITDGETTDEHLPGERVIVATSIS